MLPGISGLWWVWTHKLYVFNGTKHVVYVCLNDSAPSVGVDIGTGISFPITKKTRMVTLSYYTDTRGLMRVFVLDNGSWTTKLTPMVPPSCYTNDRQMGGRVYSRKNHEAPCKITQDTG